MIPDFQTIMLPFLKAVADKEQHSMRELIEKLALQFKLTGSERKELLPSGQQQVFDNRVGWSRTFLKKAGLVESPKRGVVIISDRGLQVLSQNPDKINVAFLRQYPEFLEFQIQNTDNLNRRMI